MIRNSARVQEIYGQLKKFANLGVKLTLPEVKRLDSLVWDGGGDMDIDRLSDLYAHQLGAVEAFLKTKNQGQNKTKSGQTVHEQGVAEGWSDAMVARRTGQPRTPYSVYIKGRKWKDFENDDHARAVMDKLKAKFKADGRDPSVITIAPTDIPEGYNQEVDEVMDMPPDVPPAVIAPAPAAKYMAQKPQAPRAQANEPAPKHAKGSIYSDDETTLKVYKPEQYREEKTRLDPKCWTGKKIGNPKTKVKGGVRVNNCVPAESVEQGVTEAPIANTDDPMNPVIHGHEKANPMTLQGRIGQARNQLRDLARMADSNELATWEQITKLAQGGMFMGLEQNLEQIRHGIEELAKKRTKGGVASRGISKDIGR
jgi:hypothetical protein